MKSKPHRVYTSKIEVTLDALRGLSIAATLAFVGFLPLMFARRVLDFMGVPSEPTGRLGLEGGGTFIVTTAAMIVFLLAMIVIAIRRQIHHMYRLSELDADDEKDLVRMLATNPPRVEMIRAAIHAGVPMRYRDIEYVDSCYAPEEALRAKERLKEQVNKDSAA